MKTNIYRLLNHCKIDIENYQEMPINEIEKYKIKLNFSKELKRRNKFQTNKKLTFKNYKQRKIILASIILLFVFSPIVNADVRSKLSDLKYSFNNFFSMGSEADSYHVNETFDSHNISIKINDLLIDEDTLNYNIIFDCSKLNKDSSSEKQWHVNISNSMKIYLNKQLLDIKTGDSTYKNLGNDLYASVGTLRLNKVYKIEDINEVRIEFSEILLSELGSTEHKILNTNKKICFRARGDEISKNIKKYYPKKRITTSLGEFEIEKISLHPIFSRLRISTNQIFETPIILKAKISNKNKYTYFQERFFNRSNGKTVYDLYFYNEASDFNPIELSEKDMMDLELYISNPKKKNLKDEIIDKQISEKIQVNLE